MKARRPDIGPRERLRGWLLLLDQVYGGLEPRHGERLAALDRGEPIRCHSYEIDLPPGDYVEVHADGTVRFLEP